ncbi:hypothetical protein GCM10007067_14750 [Lysobacter bugurensis]|uniref:Uncharacterized protein n=1 Tax=Cognatilysobacter bugurensis TaxID=543356 RepID=A0A918SZI4_9GAMM|nr:hypothetical protein GCM10007067_14750 [Lysobacter bugurensis]
MKRDAEAGCAGADGSVVGGAALAGAHSSATASAAQIGRSMGIPWKDKDIETRGQLPHRSGPRMRLPTLPEALRLV